MPHYLCQLKKAAEGKDSEEEGEWVSEWVAVCVTFARHLCLSLEECTHSWRLLVHSAHNFCALSLPFHCCLPRGWQSLSFFTCHLVSVHCAAVAVCTEAAAAAASALLPLFLVTCAEVIVSCCNIIDARHDHEMSSVFFGCYCPMCPPTSWPLLPSLSIYLFNFTS